MSIKTVWKKITATVSALALAVLGFLGLHSPDTTSADPTYAVAWTLPTQYTDNSALPASHLASTTIVYKVNGGAATTKVVAAPGTSTTIPKNLGTTCVAAFVTTSAASPTPGVSSAQTPDVCVALTGPPSPPGNLTVQ